MELNREAVFDKRLDVVEIAKKVVGYFDGGLHVIRSDQNSEKLVRRVSLFVVVLVVVIGDGSVDVGGVVVGVSSCWSTRCWLLLVCLLSLAGERERRQEGAGGGWGSSCSFVSASCFCRSMFG